MELPKEYERLNNVHCDNALFETLKKRLKELPEGILVFSVSPSSNWFYDRYMEGCKESGYRADADSEYLWQQEYPE